MPWFYVDDGFSDSKPVMDMPDRHRLAACGLWVLAGSWSAKEELDGFVPTSKLRQIGARPPIIAALTEPGPMSAPLCAEVPGGIQFNSWEKWQPTKAELEAERIENARKREADAERKRAERAAENDGSPVPSRRRRKGRNAVTSADIDSAPESPPVASDSCPVGHGTDVQCDSRARAGARLDPTRPDPTRPSLSVETLGGGVASGDARDPRPQCPEHQENSNTPCPDCRRRREWDEANEKRLAADELDAKRRAKELRENCPICHGTNWVPGTDPAVKCNHQEAQHA